MSANSGLTPGDLPKLLELLHYAQQFPDYPKNFNWSIVFDPNRPRPFNHNKIVPSAIATCIIASLFVILRLATRLHRKEWGLDDTTMSITGVLFIAFCIIQILFVTIGKIGHHTYDISYPDLQKSVQITHWDLVIYLIVVQLLRTSIFLYLKRITPRKAVVTLRVIWATFIFTGIFFVIAMLLNWVSCRNPAAIWSLDVRLVDDRCLDWKNLILGISCVLTACDIWTFLMPMHYVWKFRLPKRSLIAVMFVFAVGGLSIAASLARLFYIYPSYNSFDADWNGNGAILWLQYEISFGIIAACLPPLNCFVTEYIPDWLGKARAHPTVVNWFGSSSDEEATPVPPYPDTKIDEFNRMLSWPQFAKADGYNANVKSLNQKDDFVTGHDFFTDSESASHQMTASDSEKGLAQHISCERAHRLSYTLREDAVRQWPKNKDALHRSPQDWSSDRSPETITVETRSIRSSSSKDTSASLWILQKP